MAAALPSILGGVSAISQIDSQRKADSRADRAGKLQKEVIDRQIAETDANKPLLDTMRARFGPMIDMLAGNATDGLRRGNQFDAGKQTEQALSAYDSGSSELLKGALGTGALGRVNRGFGNKTSESSAQNSDITARIAGNRGKFSADLRLGEQDRNDAVKGRAGDQFARAFQQMDPTGKSQGQVNALAGPAQSLGAQSQFQSQLASQFDPSGSIASITSGLPGLNRVLSRRKTGQISGKPDGSSA